MFNADKHSEGAALRASIQITIMLLLAAALLVAVIEFAATPFPSDSPANASAATPGAPAAPSGQFDPPVMVP
jgi:hypothetical protein